jgi:hypothetical protein
MATSIRHLSQTKRDLLNVLAGALAAIVASGFYDCIFLYLQNNMLEFWDAIIASLATLAVFVVYLVVFLYFAREPIKKQTIQKIVSEKMNKMIEKRLPEKIHKLLLELQQELKEEELIDEDLIEEVDKNKAEPNDAGPKTA